jgi:hypothetical protein
MSSLTTSLRASSNGPTPVSLHSEQFSQPVLRIESERVELARAALAAAFGVPGVLGADVGPNGTFVTETATGERLPGVSCVAASPDGYDVSLRLVCGLVALYPLGERIRTAVLRSGVLAGVTVQRVSVHVAELGVMGEL